jgi:hypothetical protein
MCGEQAAPETRKKDHPMNKKVVIYLIALLCTIGTGIGGLVTMRVIEVGGLANDYTPCGATCLAAYAGILFLLLPLCVIAGVGFLCLLLRNLGKKPAGIVFLRLLLRNLWKKL